MTTTGVGDESRLIKDITNEKQVINKLMKHARGGIPSVTEHAALYTKLDDLLKKLEEEVQMTPKLKSNTRINSQLLFLYANPSYNFPNAYKLRAQALMQKWEAEDRGAPPPAPVAPAAPAVPLPALVVASSSSNKRSSDEDSSFESDGLARVSKKRRTTDNGTAARGAFIYPLDDDPIWGIHGVMHGLCLYQEDGNQSVVRNPRLQEGNCKAFGHNGFQPGAWFAKQMVALQRGAHGSKIGGIAGTTATGAYSIIISGGYEDLDKDNGTRIFYSGSSSHDNTDPRTPAPASRGSKALQTSLHTGRPVRVLRAAKGNSRYRPQAGIRYDGLYTVVATHRPLNKKGGRYEQFELVRDDGQVDLEFLRTNYPNGRQIEDWGSITNNFRRQR